MMDDPLNLLTQPANRDPITPRTELWKTGVAASLGTGLAYVTRDSLPIPPEVIAIVFTAILKSVGNFGRSLAVEGMTTGKKILGAVLGWLG